MTDMINFRSPSFTLPSCSTFNACWIWFKVRWGSTSIFLRAVDKYGE